MSLDEMFQAASGKPLGLRTMFERHLGADDDHSTELHHVSAIRLPWWGTLLAIAFVILLAWALAGPEWDQFMHRMDELSHFAAWWASGWKS